MNRACVFLVLGVAAVCPSATRADAGNLVKKTAEVVFERWGAKVVGSVAALAQRIEALAVRHGHEALEAVKRIGPRTFQIVEQAGAHGKDAVRLMAKHGEHAVSWILNRPQAFSQFLKHGDKAAAVLVKHPGIGEGIIGKFGHGGIGALEAVGPQGGRRMAMLMEGGALSKVSRSHELLEVIGKFGDKAMTFVWEHKGALATTAGLTAFLAHPEDFINGAKDLAGIVGANLVHPVAQIPGAVATEMAKRTNWTLIILGLGGAGLAFLAAKCGLFAKRLHARAQVPLEVTPAATAPAGKPSSAEPGASTATKQ